MQDDRLEFDLEVKNSILAQGKDLQLKAQSIQWFANSGVYKYSYHFKWMGIPIIQLPQDIVAMQELIWEVKPDLIIETGVARGGSVIFYSSMLELLGNGGKVIGIDIDIREHNRKAIEQHPMHKNICLMEGSSIDKLLVDQVKQYITDNRSKNIMVLLDSSHTHAHVLKELKLYSAFVTKGSYLVVFDTIVEDMPDDFYVDRPWGKKNNPKTAVYEFLKNHSRFVIDKDINDKLLISVAIDGYLKCVE